MFLWWGIFLITCFLLLREWAKGKDEGSRQWAVGSGKTAASCKQIQAEGRKQKAESRKQYTATRGPLNEKTNELNNLKT